MKFLTIGLVLLVPILLSGCSEPLHNETTVPYTTSININQGAPNAG